MRTNSRLAVGSPTVRVVAILAATLLLTALVAATGIIGSRVLAAPSLIIVAADGSGTVTTLTEALAMSSDGDTVELRPGTYVESVVIDKDLVVTGDGTLGEIVIAGDGTLASLVSIVDSEAAISNLAFAGEGSTISVSGGAPTLSGLSFDAVGVAATAEDAGIASLVLDHGTTASVTDSSFGAGGIAVLGAAAPLIERNTLTGGPNIQILDAGDATMVRGNTISDAATHGIVLEAAGSYVVEGNSIGLVLTAGPNAIVVRGSDVTPIIRENSLTNSRIGIEVDGASPAILGNDFELNGWGIIMKESDAVVEGNRIDGGTSAIVIGDLLQPALPQGPSSPAITDNQLGGNRRGITVGGASTALIADNVICLDEPEEDGHIRVYEGAVPTLENNELLSGDCPVRLLGEDAIGG